MEKNELNNTTPLNNIYDIIDYNGTRVRKLKKTVKPIHIDNKTYFVPRADKSYGIINALYLFGSGESFSFDGKTENDKVLSMNDIQSQGSNICCCFDTDTTSESDIMEQNVIMTIFREGEGKPFFQEHIKENYEDYDFASSLDIPIGRYIMIVSGATSNCPAYKHEEAYSIYHFEIVSSRSSYSGIKEARILSDKTIIGTLHPVVFDIEHIDPFSKDEMLKGLCIDEEMNVLGFKNIHFSNNTDRYSHLSFESDYPWIENKQYTLIIGDYNEVKSTLTFNISNHPRCMVNIHHFIKKEYRNIYHEFLNNDKLLRTIYPTPGLSMIKKQAWQLYDKNKYAQRVNDAAEKTILPTMHNLIVNSDRPNFTPRSENAAVVANFYINNIGSFEWLNMDVVVADKEWEQLDNNNDVSIWCNLSNLKDCRALALNHMKNCLMTSNHVTLYDTPHAIEQFFNTFPELKPFFEKEYSLVEAPPTAIEVIAQFITSFKQTNYPLSDEALAHICRHMVTLEQQGYNLARYNEENIKYFIQSHVVKQVRNRCYNCPAERIDKNWEELYKVIPADLDFSVIEQDANLIDINEILSELNEMVGLNMIKDNLTDLSTQLMFNRKRCELGLPDVPQPCHHMIFSGNPGTGKTTVAKMIGKIFHSLGLLSKGEVIALERKDLVGEYIGHTESNMLKILEEAKGNVLFIDEAYSLADNSPQSKDFGRHVVEALLPILAQEQVDMLVIMAGYKDEMKELMESNTGLKGRFPHFWHFENYNADELLLIACNHLDKMSFQLTDQAKTRLRTAIVEELRICDKYFSNARWIKQQITHSILPRMAKRVMQSPQRNDAAFFSTIETDDIAINTSCDKNAENRRTPIGFHTIAQDNVA